MSACEMRKVLKLCEGLGLAETTTDHIWYHWTPYEFTKFRRGEMGIHFGARTQAHDIFLKHRMGGDGRFVLARLHYRHPFRSKADVGDWSSRMRWLVYLDKHERIGKDGDLQLTPQEYARLAKPRGRSDITREDFGFKVMMPFLKRRGYDAIEYPNSGEGHGRYNGPDQETAVLVFDPDQVTILGSESPRIATGTVSGNDRVMD